MATVAPKYSVMAGRVTFTILAFIGTIEVPKAIANKTCHFLASKLAKVKPHIFLEVDKQLPTQRA